ncbi:MAG: DUF4349 domain-containing protein, partial [Planctomycetota bacterium]
MTENQDQHLEAELSALTRWEGEPTELWKQALDEADAAPQGRKLSLGRLMHSPLLKAAAVIVVLLGAVAVLPFIAQPAGYPEAETEAPASVGDRRGPTARGELMPGESPGRGTGGSAQMYLESVASLQVTVPGSGDADFGERHVVRKATIELVTDDVAALFVRCTQLLSEVHGEFIESSSLSGSGIEARANLTMRVATSRLTQVLNDLRQLGTVRSEEARGEDVTDQVVDIEARLSNERRIEAELLELLEKRDDAPLKDVLELRRQISAVRESVERLVARQQRMSQLTELASVLVIIRPEAAPEEPETETGLGAYFSDRIDASWTE